MPQSIAFHSYKGGTGKSTIAANLAAALVLRGYKVALIDLDVYAPSLHVYFNQTPDKWINDLLSDNAELADVMIDMTATIEKLAVSPNQKIGKLWVGFSNPQKEEVYKLEGGIAKQTNAKIQLLRKFIQLRDDLISDYGCDYVIIDTSPGIRFWSINSLAIADILLLTLKFGELDIEGTRKMANDIYDSFKKFGAKPYLLLNRVSGYCVPHHAIATTLHSSNKLETINMSHSEDSQIGDTLSSEIGMDMISSIPCYCDIQFSRKEFLTILQHPDHPFARQLDRLAESKQIRVEG